MKRIIFVFIFILGHLTLQSQTVIAKQSFEASGDTWTPINFSTPPCTVGNDVWNYSTSLSSITPNEGAQFWGIRDLNGSCGGNGFETITLPNVNISSFSNVSFSFDYNAIGLDNNEDLKYELFYNGVSQGEVIVVNGVNGNSDNTNGWLTETVSIPGTINNVSVVLSARSNQGNDIAAFDNITLIDGAVSGVTNDNCSGAIALTVGTDSSQNIITGTNVGATDSGVALPNNCDQYLGGDVWYTAEVPASGELNIETSNAGGITDTGVAVYIGTCGSLTQIACDADTGPGFFSIVNLTGLSNTTVYIRVWEYQNNNFGEFNIVAYSVPTPTNSDCADSVTLSVGSTNTENIVTGTNEGALDSGEFPSPTCAIYGGRDVWFTAQIPSNGVLFVETQDAGSSIDTAMAIYTGNCGSLTQIACDDDSGPGLFSEITLTGLPNTTVYIRVFSWNNQSVGDFNIVAYSPECPFTSTWNGSSWNNGVPDIGTAVVINGNYDTASNGNFDACSCTINGGTTVNIRANNYISILNDLSVNGTLEVRHEGALVMVEDDGVVTSSGTINIHKTTTPYNDPLDYTYWTSPTINETFGSAFASSRPDRFFEFNAVTGWIAKTGTDVLEIAKGYIASAPNSGSFPQTQSVIFDGLVNNGVIETSNFPVINGNWDIIGNPYPSAISADSFLDDPLNSSVVDGTIYLWTHNTPISDGTGDERYNYSASDYASYTVAVGGTAATGDSKIPDGFIASAQGFLAKGLTNETATFNNSMRVITNNDQFFKTSEKQDAKDRIWLNLYNNKGAFSQVLVGFIDKGTDGIDRYDGPKFGGSYVSFYSLVESKRLAAQSKPTLKDEEIIKLGLYSYIEEGDSLKISIERIEGQLTNYNIYLKDKLLEVIHDLTVNDYSFLPESQSIYNDRFELFLTKSQITLNTDDIDSVRNELLVLNLQNGIEIKTSNSSTITKLKIYDILGKTIVNTEVNDTSYTLKTANIAKGTVLIVNATLADDNTFIKKLLVH